MNQRRKFRVRIDRALPAWFLPNFKPRWLITHGVCAGAVFRSSLREVRRSTAVPKVPGGGGGGGGEQGGPEICAILGFDRPSESKQGLVVFCAVRRRRPYYPMYHPYFDPRRL